MCDDFEFLVLIWCCKQWSCDSFIFVLSCGSILLFTVVLQGARASICRFILFDDIWWRCFASASDREILIYLSSLFLVESFLCFLVLTFVVLFNLPSSTATLIDCYLYFKYPEGYCKEYLVVIVIIVDVISVGFIDKLRFKYVSVSSCRIRTREQKLFKCFIACKCVSLLSSFIPRPECEFWMPLWSLSFLRLYVNDKCSGVQLLRSAQCVV